jgi:hypothetical protein
MTYEISAVLGKSGVRCPQGWDSIYNAAVDMSASPFTGMNRTWTAEELWHLFVAAKEGQAIQ